MSEVVAEPVADVSSSPVAENKVKKAAAAAVVKKPKAKPTHPPCSEMVDAAIGALKERGGSSVLAIKKYVATIYKVDVEKLAPFIKRYVKTAVVKGHLLQTKGKGASGSFKLSTKAAPPTTKKIVASNQKKPVVAKPKADVKKTATKKSSAPKKKPVVAKAKVAITIKKAGTVIKAKPKTALNAAPKTKKAAATTVKKPATKKVSVKK